MKGSSLKTIVYVDGFNLYYGLLSKTQYKWLDILAFVERIMVDAGPKSDIVELKYFTAPIKEAFGSDRHSMERQRRYINAIKAQHPKKVVVIEGFFQALEADLRRVDNEQEKVLVTRFEEKQTDVNIAAEMLIDAHLDRMEHAVVVSNDSDLGGLFERFKIHFESITLGHIAPLKVDGGRPPSGHLTNNSDWSRVRIKDEDLVATQLPRSVVKTTGKKKPYIKPDAWATDPEETERKKKTD